MLAGFEIALADRIRAAYVPPARALETLSAARAEALLNRYPDISEAEVAILLRTFAHLPLLHFGLLAADDQLGDKLDLFYRDHGEKVPTSLSSASWAMWAIALMALAVLLWVAA